GLARRGTVRGPGGPPVRPPCCAARAVPPAGRAVTSTPHVSAPSAYHDDMPRCPSAVYRRAPALGRVDAMQESTSAGPTARTAVTPAPTRWPGILPCAAAALAAYGAGLLLPGVSPLILAIIAGIVVANLVPLPRATAPGIAFCAKPVLRAGIVLLGLQVVLGDILGLGAGM